MNDWLRIRRVAATTTLAERKFRPTVTHCRQHRVQIEMFAFVKSYLIPSRQMIHSMRKCRLVASAGPHTYTNLYIYMNLQFDMNDACEARGNGFLITRLMAPGIEQPTTLDEGFAHKLQPLVGRIHTWHILVRRVEFVCLGWRLLCTLFAICCLYFCLLLYLLRIYLRFHCGLCVGTSPTSHLAVVLL